MIEALEHDSRMLCSCATLMVYPLTGILTSGCCLSRASRLTATALRCISNTAAPTRFAVKIAVLSLTPIAKYGPKGVVRGRIAEETEEAGEGRVITNDQYSSEVVSLSGYKNGGRNDSRGVRERLVSVYLITKRCGGNWARKCGKKTVADGKCQATTRRRKITKTKKREKEREMERPREGDMGSYLVLALSPEIWLSAQNKKRKISTRKAF